MNSIIRINEIRTSFSGFFGLNAYSFPIYLFQNVFVKEPHMKLTPNSFIKYSEIKLRIPSCFNPSIININDNLSI